MNRLRILIACVALGAQAQDGRRTYTVVVGAPFIDRARDEAELDALIRRDVEDAGHNIVDVRTRARIRALCLKLEVDE